MKKNYLIISVVVLSIIGVVIFALKDTKNVNKGNVISYDTTNYLGHSNMEVKDVVYHAYFLHEYTPEYLKESADAIVLASIISIDGADNKYDVAVGNTYGKLVVNNVLWGSKVNEKDVLEYTKSGGIMKVSDYEENQPDSAKEKIKNLWKENNINADDKYINLKYENEPDLEEGKVYLCYLKYNKDLEKYAIIGLDKGLRELNVNKTAKVSNSKMNIRTYQIKNNTTGNFESLISYYNNYIIEK